MYLIHGCKCIICGFDYVEFYGKYVEGFIQIHHIKSISEIGGLDPITDLNFVYANCHFNSSEKESIKS